MGIHSIRFKMTFLLVTIVASLVILLLVINVAFAEKFYISGKSKTMHNTYDKVNEIIAKYDSGEINKTTMMTELDSYVSANAMQALVVDSDWTTVYVSNMSGDNRLLQRLMLSILLGGAGKAEENSEDTEELNPKDYRVDFDKFRQETVDILSTTNNYTIQKVYDKAVDDSFMELWGSLDNGDSIIIRLPIQSIKDNIEISNTLIRYVGISVMFIGLVAVFIFSAYITKPIKELSKIAERMSELDFDAKYTGKDKGEVGLLGNSMNDMSSKLEKTISKLKSANLELKRDIDKKEQIEQMRTDFLSNVSHELKTPIALIQGYAEGLKDGIADDVESRNYYIDVIIDEAAKMNTMVKRLLTLNQLEFGDDEPIMERFDIAELVRSVVNANEIRANQKNLKIITENADNTLYAWGDEIKVEEVITNYISNAINHCKGDNLIKVTIENKDDANIRVKVFNTGDAIPDEDIDRIWEKFYKVDKARTREYGGNGIGLSIVKAIMTSMGKEAGVRNVDNGVEFWFDLDCDVK